MRSDCRHADSTPCRPRVRFIWDYSPRTNLRAKLVSLGVFIVGGVPLTLGMFRALRALNAPSSLPFSLELLVTLAFGIATFVTYMRVVERFMPRGARSSKPKRIDRLNRLLNHPKGPVIFPHRKVEWDHYQIHEKSLSLNAPISKLEPGEVIVLNCPRLEMASWVRSSQITFEPIHWRWYENRVKWLASTIDDADDSSPSARNQLRRRQALRDFLFQGLPSGAFICGTIGCTIFMHDWLEYAAIMTVFAFGGIVALCMGRHFILVPGGLVRLKNGLFFRKTQLEFFNYRNASLVLYANGGAYVASRGKSFFLPSDTKMVTALLVAWLSEAQTPTMEQLCTLLAPEIMQSSHAVEM